MAKKYYTEKGLVTALITLARGKSSYKAKAPWNLLYWDGTRFWADCNNLYKALFNGRSIVNPKVGSSCTDLSNTDDCSEWGLMKQCDDRSTDFTKLSDHFECLYMDGHFGGYLGFEWNEPNQGLVNCVESTPAWEDGIQFSYVDSQGRRFWKKGGAQRGTWEVHGTPYAFVDYSERADVSLATGAKATTVVDNTAQTSASTAVATVKGKIDTATFIGFLPVVQKGSSGQIVKVLQQVLKTLGYHKGYVDGEAGAYTVAGIKAFQKAKGLTQDGSFGPKSWTALLYGTTQTSTKTVAVSGVKEGSPLTKEQADSMFKSMTVPTYNEVKTLGKAMGMDDDSVVALVAWVEGEGYWADSIGDPYFAYLSACVVVNNIVEKAYGSNGAQVIKKIASWGGYYSEAKQRARAASASNGALKATYMALKYLQTGIHCCYGPGYKPQNCFYDPHFKSDDWIYVF